MKSLNLNNFRPVRFLIATFVCTLLFFTSAFPAMASVSRPSNGAVSLDEVQNRTDEVAKSQPRSLEELQADANGGLNAVQGKADYNKMNRPGNSQDATTVKEQVKEGLKNIIPGKN